MNINQIMEREIEDARKEALKCWEDRHVVETAKRRARIARAVNITVLTAILIVIIVAAIVIYGHK